MEPLVVLKGWQIQREPFCGSFLQVYPQLSLSLSRAPSGVLASVQLGRPLDNSPGVPGLNHG